MSTRAWRRIAALLAVLAVLATGACTGDRPELQAGGEADTTTTTRAQSTTTTEPGPAPSFVAEATGESIDVYDGADGQVTRTLQRADEVSGRLVFLIDGFEGSADWYEVHLPVRPNGSKGWVRASDVDVTQHGFRIEVRLAAHNLKVYDGREVVLDEPVAIGKGATPTPGGTFYLKELLKPPTPDGPYGTYAYGLSGFSNVVTSFNGGEGVIGIHGTNDPSKIGTDVSSGCIRLRNEAINRLVDEIGLPLGTPVDIIA